MWRPPQRIWHPPKRIRRRMDTIIHHGDARRNGEASVMSHTSRKRKTILSRGLGLRGWVLWKTWLQPPHSWHRTMRHSLQLKLSLLPEELNQDCRSNCSRVLL
ncbi:hypothetical protein GUJ93_ZPchr0012g22010 [Zizania palustris]|uniref:Uncharacterized protein n=1 Tax=Zizania palustris TaxID=103762 RepID=A0A8J5WU01_ZIZPA|nr:hypothetical protein GUJ93_ZPchr0012g22010 [Zizania palustris]